MKKVIAVLVVVLLLAGGAYAVYARQQAAAQPAAPPRTAVVQRQTIENTVSATGNLSAQARYTLKFTGAGRITALNAAIGDRVVAGQVLATLDDASLRLDLNDALTQLAISQVKLAQVQAPATAGDLAAAEANLNAAQAALGDLARAADPNQVEISRLGIERAKIQLWQAQLANPDPSAPSTKYVPQYLKDLGRLRTEAGDLTVAQAQTNYQQAQAGATREQLSAARAQVDQASAQVDRLKAGASDADVALVQAQIDAAQLAVDAAQARLQDATLTAPAAGIVAAVYVNQGEVASPALPVITLVDDSAFHLDIAVDEVDVAQLAVGQPVTITLDALPDKSLAGRVDQIAAVSSGAVNAGTTSATGAAGATGATGATGAGSTRAVVSYSVRVALTDADPRVREGMTANASVITEQRAGVLVVPNWAVRIDRQTGQAYVPIRHGDKVEEVSVTLGLRNENVSEVLSGVNEGDQIEVSSSTNPFTFGNR